jgi:thiamine-monophosphate kinase
MPSEFDLIRRHFSPPTTQTLLAGGDDAALLVPTPGHVTAVSTDMLVEGTHFLPGTDPRRLGHKTLAVNLSDLAAMGARPRWAFLALALPRVDEAWLAAFSAGFLALAAVHGVDLAGGDTTRGPLNLCVTVIGEAMAGNALRRDGAVPGDDVWLSGCTGEAAIGLAALRGAAAVDAIDEARCRDRLEQPQPRVGLGVALAGLASAAIDVSDGLVADLRHLAARSACGIDVHWARLPQSSALAGIDAERRAAAILAGGDDYELAFTASPVNRDAVLAAAQSAGVVVTRIGATVAGPAVVRVLDPLGFDIAPAGGGFDHFG